MGLNYFGYSEPGPFLLVFLQWVITLTVLLVIFEILFNILPDTRPFEWKWITPGATVAMVLWLAFSFGWKTYLQAFNNYDKIYGSIGAGIVLMLWLYLTALAILVGGMINAFLRELREVGTEKQTISESENKNVDNAS